MKVYAKKSSPRYSYPEDMKAILDYLNEHGTLYVKENTIEDLYRDFSDEKYCAGWMGVVDSHSRINYDLLERFADWLEEVDI